VRQEFLLTLDVVNQRPRIGAELHELSRCSPRAQRHPRAEVMPHQLHLQRIVGSTAVLAAKRLYVLEHPFQGSMVELDSGPDR